MLHIEAFEGEDPSKSFIVQKFEEEKHKIAISFNLPGEHDQDKVRLLVNSFCDNSIGNFGGQAQIYQVAQRQD
jgi:hypothetical protein